MTVDVFVSDDDDELDADGVTLDTDDAILVADDVTVGADDVVVTVIVVLVAGGLMWDDSPLQVPSLHGKAPENNSHHHPPLIH